MGWIYIKKEMLPELLKDELTQEEKESRAQENHSFPARYQFRKKSTKDWTTAESADR